MAQKTQHRTMQLHEVMTMLARCLSHTTHTHIKFVRVCSWPLKYGQQNIQTLKAFSEWLWV